MQEKKPSSEVKADIRRAGEIAKRKAGTIAVEPDVRIKSLWLNDLSSLRAESDEETSRETAENDQPSPGS